MKVAYSWLRELVELPQDPAELADRFSETGTAVESVVDTGKDSELIVTAQIVKKEKHPDSDHLWVTHVDVGADELLQIVCGAQNFNEGDHIVTAQVGAVLPGDFKIKKSKLRGVASNGMNCSARELGLGDEHDGILILPDDAPIGVPFSRYSGMSDVIFDLEITPNRPDCESVAGIAREVAAIYEQEFSLDLPRVTEGETPVANHVSVEIKDTSRCPRYTARVVKGVKVGSSPEWLKRKVESCGARSINNIVDVTNYIMFFLGQPLHAFDLDKLAAVSGVVTPAGELARVEIGVRAAREGETLVTLDEQERELNPDMTVITVADRPVALAGVMGGLSTEVDDATTSIVIESAGFSSAHTSRTSRSLQLFSESSRRYERGVDVAQSALASEAACALIAEVAGGEVLQGIVDVYPEPVQAKTLMLRPGRCRQHMGAEITDEFMVGALTRLGCTVSPQPEAGEGTLEVIVPTYRPDLEREIDLYEEIIRLWGMERVPSTLPVVRRHPGGLSKTQRIRRLISRTLRASGVSQTMTYSLVDEGDLMPEPERIVRLLNPISSEQGVLRQLLLPGLMQSLAYNRAHGIKSAQLYEMGTVFVTQKDNIQPRETERIAAVLAGSWFDQGWQQKPVEIDFFDAKAVLENLAHALHIAKLRVTPIAEDERQERYGFLQPGRAALVWAGKIQLGWLGEVHPLYAAEFDLKGRVAAFELDEQALISVAQVAGDFVGIPPYPSIDMDLSLVVDDEVPSERLLQVIQAAGGKLLESVRLFDVYYDDERVGVGKKSLTFSLTYRAADRTLTGNEVDAAHAKIIKKLQGATGAVIREE